MNHRKPLVRHCPPTCTCREYCDVAASDADSYRHSEACPLDAILALTIDRLYNDNRST
jgi:hypothetical protein